MDEQPRTLERQLAAASPNVEWEKAQQLMWHMYKRNRDAFEKNRTPTSNPVAGQHKFYLDVGAELLEFFGINDSVQYFSELEGRMLDLGKAVAFLVAEFNDSGLIHEENAWLIRRRHLDGHLWTYDAADNLREDNGRLKWPFRDCTSEEMLHLYVAYQRGKLNFFTEGMAYGASLTKKQGE